MLCVVMIYFPHAFSFFGFFKFFLYSLKSSLRVKKYYIICTITRGKIKKVLSRLNFFVFLRKNIFPHLVQKSFRLIGAFIKEK